MQLSVHVTTLKGRRILLFSFFFILFGQIQLSIILHVIVCISLKHPRALLCYFYFHFGKRWNDILCARVGVCVSARAFELNGVITVLSFSFFPKVMYILEYIIWWRTIFCSSQTPTPFFCSSQTPAPSLLTLLYKINLCHKSCFPKVI